MFNTSKHIRFYEVVNYHDAPINNYMKLIICLGQPLPEDPEECSTLLYHTIDAQDSIFPSIQDTTVKLTFEYGTLGIYLKNNPDKYRVFLSYVHPGTC